MNKKSPKAVEYKMCKTCYNITIHKKGKCSRCAERKINNSYKKSILPAGSPTPPSSGSIKLFLKSVGAVELVGSANSREEVNEWIENFTNWAEANGWEKEIEAVIEDKSVKYIYVGSVIPNHFDYRDATSMPRNCCFASRKKNQFRATFN